MKSLSDLLLALALPFSPEHNMVQINHLCLHSQHIRPNSLFLAIKGHSHDGRNYIADAISRGAAAIFYETSAEPITHSDNANCPPLIAIDGLNLKLGAIAKAFYGPIDEHKTLIGVTGTDGKSSVAYFVAQALSLAQMPCGLISTLGQGTLTDLTPGPNTTPDALSLFQSLVNFKHQNIDYIALEASSQGLNEGRLNNIAIDIAIFTNLTPEHQDYHLTMEHYANAKARLFKIPSLRCAIVNRDDPYADTLLMACRPEVKRITYSQNNAHADIHLIKATPTQLGVNLIISTPKGIITTHTQLLGRFNISNILALVGTCLQLKLTLKRITSVLPAIVAPPGRMQLISTPAKLKAPTVIIDYAHTDNALHAALSALKYHFKIAKIWCVFGCGGERDRDKRPRMAQIAEKLSHRVIITLDNPRNENPDQIMQDILNGFSTPKAVKVIHDRKAAIRYALSMANPTDIILVAGKGHETIQIINDTKITLHDESIVNNYYKDQKPCSL